MVCLFGMHTYYSYFIVLKSFFNCTDIPAPVGVRAEVTADNTSIRMSWQWSRQGEPMCVDLVRVHYRPEGGSLMMYTVDSTTATSATLPNLQCNTKYTIWVSSRSKRTVSASVLRVVSVPPRGMSLIIHISCIEFTICDVMFHWVIVVSHYIPHQPLPLLLPPYELLVTLYHSSPSHSD